MKALLFTLSLIVCFGQAIAQDTENNPSSISEERDLLDDNTAFQLSKQHFDNAQIMIQDKATGAAAGIEGLDAEIERLMELSREMAGVAYDLGKKDKPVLDILIATNEFRGNEEEVKFYRKELKRLPK